MQLPNPSAPQPNLPRVAIIVAMTRNRVIGSRAGLPWNLPEDLQLFKRLTKGCSIIMGHRTFASIGRPLPERHCIVLSRSQAERPGVEICNSFLAGLIKASQFGRPIFIIGGEQIYRKALAIASEMHVSWVKEDVPGDVYFPEFDLADWSIHEEHDYAGFRYVCYHHIERARRTSFSRALK